MKAAIRPMMKNKFGRIINITSIVGLTEILDKLPMLHQKPA